MLIDRDHIATLLGMTRAQVRRTVEPREDFPRPVLRLSRKTVRWAEEDVRRWLQQQRQRA
jgi:predicted DNA-binding transcriptional regulator AlpA